MALHSYGPYSDGRYGSGLYSYGLRKKLWPMRVFGGGFQPNHGDVPKSKACPAAQLAVLHRRPYCTSGRIARVAILRDAAGRHLEVHNFVAYMVMPYIVMAYVVMAYTKSYGPCVCPKMLFAETTEHAKERVLPVVRMAVSHGRPYCAGGHIAQSSGEPP